MCVCVEGNALHSTSLSIYKKCTFVCEGVCVYVWRGMCILCMCACVVVRVYISRGM